MQAAPLRDRMAVNDRRKATAEEVQEVLVSLGAVEDEPTTAKEATATPTTPPPLDASLEEQAQADSTTAGNIKAIHRKTLASNRVTGIAYEADKQITAHGITAEPDTESAAAVASGSRPSVPYLKTCQELLKARATYYGVMEQNHQGDFAAYDTEASGSKRSRKPGEETNGG